jgi:threonine/homoserine/homoserine lactone efflux protein
MAAEAPAGRPRSWLKGILTNLLNPHPWLFWLTVGTATLAIAIAQGWPTAVAFLSGFYLLLVGSKVVVVQLAARSRDLLAGRPYRVVMRVLALLLTFFALLLFREGWKDLAGA